MYSNTEWTNNEASRTKLYLSQQGYIDDQFVKYFCNQALKRAPEINRGYFARVHCIAHSVKRFCCNCTEDGSTSVLDTAGDPQILNSDSSSPTSSKGAAQIVNIGAGFDTLFWRLASDPKVNFSRYVDVDCNEVIGHKIRAIQSNEELLSLCGKVGKQTPSQFHSERYNALALDATKAMMLVRRLIQDCGIKKQDPIIFVFECVLLYWEEEATGNLLYTLNKTFDKCSFVIFDLVNTNDRFAQLMQQSLVEQQTPLLGANSFSTIQDWNNKLKQLGSKYVNSWIMNQVYRDMIDVSEIERIETLEFFDEIELLQQLFNHYCLVMASNYYNFTW